MKLKLYALLLIVSSTVAVADENRIVGCFTSGHINVKFVQFEREGATFGYVKYQKSGKAIPLLLISSSYEKNVGGGSDEYTTEWAEYIKGKFNGQYTIVSQGARFYRFDYKSGKNVVTEFDDNIDAYSDNDTDCKW